MGRTVSESAAYLTVDDVAARLLVSRRTVVSLCDSGELLASNFAPGKGRRLLRITAASVAEFELRRTQRPIPVTQPRRRPGLKEGGFSLLRAAGWEPGQQLKVTG